jgi:hypothetical protein
MGSHPEPTSGLSFGSAPSPQEATYANPPRRFTEPGEALTFWTTVAVPEHVAEAAARQQELHWEDWIDQAWKSYWENREAKVRHDLMVAAVRAYPEPSSVPDGSRAWVSPSNKREGRLVPLWFQSRSQLVFKDREAWFAREMKVAIQREQTHWEQNLNPSVVPERSLPPEDAATVCRIVRMFDRFDGDPWGAFRGMSAPYGGEEVTVETLRTRLGGFDHLTACTGRVRTTPSLRPHPAIDHGELDDLPADG